MIYTVMAWYAFIATLVTIGAGATFGLLYHHRTAGKWRRTVLGRHLMMFALALPLVLAFFLVRSRQLWWVTVQLAAYTAIPLVYIRQVWIFLKVQEESDESDPSN